jgi:hypothetical protein
MSSNDRGSNKFPHSNIDIPRGLSKDERDEQISNWNRAWDWAQRMIDYVPTCDEHGCELEGDPDGNYCPECADEDDEPVMRCVTCNVDIDSTNAGVLPGICSECEG